MKPQRCELLRVFKNVFFPPKVTQDPFRRLEASGQSVCIWGGLLPPTRYARHHLRVDSLASDPSREGFQPFKFAANYTHEIWIGYRYLAQPSKFRLIYHGQFDFRVPGRSTQAVALAVGNYLAKELLATKHPRHLLHYDVIDWTLSVEAVYRSFLRPALKELGISHAAFRLDPDLYKNRFSRN